MIKCETCGYWHGNSKKNCLPNVPNTNAQELIAQIAEEVDFIRACSQAGGDHEYAFDFTIDLVDLNVVNDLVSTMAERIRRAPIRVDYFLYDESTDEEFDVEIEYKRCPAEPDVGIQRPYNEIYGVYRQINGDWVLFEPTEMQKESIRVYLSELEE